VTKPPSPEPAFSLAELAHSWAEVTGDTPENILYRLGDWALTDAFSDNAFLTDAAGTATFENVGIFQRMWWHRKLSEKISEEGDPKERERLQKYADYHMQIAESAVLRRDVIINACRAMNVEPPPILGLVKESAAHAVPPELASDTLVRVGRDRQPARRRDIMAPDEASPYTLLWDAAAIQSRSNGHSLEWNWLRLMDRFWGSVPSPNGLIYFFSGHPGLEYARFDRVELARCLLGKRADERVPLKILCNWTIVDYLRQPDPFGGYFRCDPDGRVGLAARTDELTRGLDGEIANIETSVRTGAARQLDQPRRRRLAYIGLLERFVTGINAEQLAQMTDRAVLRQFEDYHRNLVDPGKSAPQLPGDLRNVEDQISKIRERLFGPGTQKVGSNVQ
jgi:hypothetical protein